MPVNVEDLDQIREIAEATAITSREVMAGKIDDAIRRDRRQRFDLDVRGLLAIMALLGCFGLAFVLVSQGKTPDIPAWAAAIVAGVTGFYFGSRGGQDG